MNKLKKVIEEINKTEKKIAEWQEQLKALKKQRKQLEDEEIIKTIRSMKGNSDEMISLLEGLQNGTLDFAFVEEKRKEGLENEPII